MVQEVRWPLLERRCRLQAKRRVDFGVQTGRLCCCTGRLAMARIRDQTSQAASQLSINQTACPRARPASRARSPDFVLWQGWEPHEAVNTSLSPAPFSLVEPWNQAQKLAGFCPLVGTGGALADTTRKFMGDKKKHVTKSSKIEKIMLHRI